MVESKELREELEWLLNEEEVIESDEIEEILRFFFELFSKRVKEVFAEVEKIERDKY
jgi:hypothetical protein